MPENLILNTEQAQACFGVSRRQLWAAAAEGRLQILTSGIGPMYRVDQLIEVFGSPRLPLPTEVIEQFVDREDVIRGMAAQRGISEEEARAVVEAEFPAE